MKIGPSDAVMRRREICGGMAAEFVQVTKHGTLEFSFCAPCHLLVVYEEGERREGDTLVEGLPPSARRSLKGNSRWFRLVMNITSATNRAFSLE